MEILILILIYFNRKSLVLGIKKIWEEDNRIVQKIEEMYENPR